MQANLTRFIRDDSGATALGGKLTNSFVNVSNKM
jgi:Flp pilus assembly pilin Flp